MQISIHHRPRHLRLRSTLKQFAAIAAVLTSAGCGRPDRAAAQQELSIRALNSDVSAMYSDVQALKSEQGLIYEQLESQNTLREEATASSGEEQKRLRTLAGKGAESHAQLLAVRQRLDEQGAQIERLRGDLLQLKKGVETLANALSDPSGLKETYLVQPGDTLEKIARKTHRSIDAIRRVNQLQNDLIVAGKTLRLPHAD